MVKKIPERQCIGCRESKPKKELLRVIRTPDEDIKLDLTGKMNGRGAYICPNSQCLAKAIKTNAISRSLNVKISDEVYNRLNEELKDIVTE